AGGIVDTGLRGAGIARSLLLQSDGKIVVTGLTILGGSQAAISLARFNANGSPDLGFGMNGKVVTGFGAIERVFATALQTDGKIVPAGFARPTSTTQQFLLIRFNPDGSPNAGFGVNGEADPVLPGIEGSTALGVAIQPDGKIVAAGQGF